VLSIAVPSSCRTIVSSESDATAEKELSRGVFPVSSASTAVSVSERDRGGQPTPEHSKLLHGRIQVVRSKGFGVKLVEDVGMNLATSATHQAIWIMLHLRHLPPYRSIACLCAHEG
jgi:hypothetical protein